MITMLIDNHPLALRRLQFIGIGVNKLTFKCINIIQSSNNYNIVSRFICWNKNIVPISKCITRMTFKRQRNTNILDTGNMVEI